MKRTDRAGTEEDIERYNLVMLFGSRCLLYIIEFIEEHPESRLREYLEFPCDSQEEANQLIKSFLKDPKTKFEYESMVEHVWKEVTGRKISLEGGRC